MHRGPMMMMVVALLASAAPAGASSIIRRGIEATALQGRFATVSDPSAPDQRAIVIARGTLAHRTLDTIRARAIEVTLAGCQQGSVVLLRVDRHPPTPLFARRDWRVVAVYQRLSAGRHAIEVGGASTSAGAGCAGTKIDRIDLVPARRADDVTLGAAVRATELVGNSQYRSLFDSDFGSMTPENELKMQYVEPSQGHYEFGPADTLVDYALANNKEIRGHVLVQGTQLPGWVRVPLLPWRPSSLLAVMRDYITTVMHRYAGEIVTWDVVNEAFDRDGSYRRNIFYRVIGPSYIEDAFRFARAADPTAQLFYNDLFLPGTQQAQAIAGMLSDFQHRGVPIDGIGFQDHADLDSYPSELQLKALFAGYAQLGLHVEVTEADVGMTEGSGSPAQREQAQAEIYRQAATACWDFAACRRFTTWGIYDGLSWLGSAAAPLLFNATYQPKPAFFAVRGALHLQRP